MTISLQTSDWQYVGAELHDLNLPSGARRHFISTWVPVAVGASTLRQNRPVRHLHRWLALAPSHSSQCAARQLRLGRKLFLQALSNLSSHSQCLATGHISNPVIFGSRNQCILRSVQPGQPHHCRIRKLAGKSTHLSEMHRI